MLSENKSTSTSSNEFELAIKRIAICKALRIARAQSSDTFPWTMQGPEVQKKANETMKQKEAELSQFDKTYLDNEKITEYIALENLWKLGVDAVDHEKGRLAYDTGKNTSEIREFGYIDAAETALAFMFRTVDEEMTPHYFAQLHFLFCCEVHLQGAGSEYVIEKKDQLRLTGGRLPLAKLYVTKEGLEEMAEYKDFFYAYVYKAGTNERIELTSKTVNECWESFQAGASGYGGHTVEDMEALFKKFVAEYKENIKKANGNEGAIILAIATFAKKVDDCHFFLDGNIRTVRALILKCLIQNKLSLTCMPDPNIIDGHSSKEIAREIKVGMEIYKKIKSSQKRITPN